MQHLSDEALVEEYFRASGSERGESALNELFGRHRVRVAAWCYRLTGDRESAADLAQDVFLKVQQSLGTFRGESKFTTWLYTVVRNHCTNVLRSRAARPDAALGLEGLDLLLSSGLDIEREAAERRLARELRLLMQQTLSDTEHRVMTLHYLDDLPLDAVGRLLGLNNKSGAKAYIVSARRKLKRAVARKTDRP